MYTLQYRVMRFEMNFNDVTDEQSTILSFISVCLFHKTLIFKPTVCSSNV